MNRNLLIGIIAAAAIIITLAFFFFNSSPSENVVENENVSLPWVEVLSPLANELSPDTKAALRELTTGDELNPGALLGTSEKGLANLYFPGGEVARLDFSTELTVKDQARLFLASGRVWSKVFGLATPDSTWRVETTNAVAVVRGTAFLVSFKNGDTTVLGSEGEVSVFVVNPQTREVIAETETKVTRNKIVEVRDEDVPRLIEARKPLELRDAPGELLKDSWLEDAQTQDIELEKKETEPILPPPTSGIQTGGGGVKSDKISPTKLILETKSSLAGVEEGDQLFFQAILLRSDGSLENVTSAVSWQVLGDIGKFTSPGVFVAQLGPEVAELGEVSGLVAAIWESGGEKFLGESPVFEVRAYVPPEDLPPPEG